MRLIAVIVIAMLALPAVASAAAGGPTEEQYKDTSRNVSAVGTGDPGDPGGLGDNVGPLPFTGFDVIAMAAVALAVTGIGLALQRAVARESE